MSFQIDTSTNGRDINAVYERILNDDPACSWAVFGYDKGSQTRLKVVASGDDKDEFLEEFDESAVLYGFLRVKDENTQLNKFVLIGWCGEAAPGYRKGLFNTHLASVTKLLPTYHVQITGRSAGDIDFDDIMKRVADASGSKYTHRGESFVASRRPVASFQRPPPATKSTAPKLQHPTIAPSLPKKSTQTKTTVDEWADTKSLPPVPSNLRIPENVKPSMSSNAPSLPPSKPATSSIPTPAPSKAVESQHADSAHLQPPATSSIDTNRPSSALSASSRSTTELGELQASGAVDLDARKALFERPGAQKSTLPPAPAPAVKHQIKRAPTVSVPANAPASAPAAAAAAAEEEESHLSVSQLRARFAKQSVNDGHSSRPRASSTGRNSTGVASRIQSLKRSVTEQQSVPQLQQPSISSAQETKPIPAPNFPQAPAMSETPIAPPVPKAPESVGVSSASVPPLPTASRPSAEVETSVPPPIPQEPRMEKEQEVPIATKQEAPVIPQAPEPVNEEAPIVSPAPQVAKEEVPAVPPIPTAPRPSNAVEESVAPTVPPVPTAPAAPAAPVTPVAPTAPVAPPAPAAPVAPIAPTAPTAPVAPPAPAAPVVANVANEPAVPAIPAEPVASSHPVVPGAIAYATALYDYEPEEENELKLTENQRIAILEFVDEGWWLGVNETGAQGLFPANYVEVTEGNNPATTATAPQTSQSAGEEDSGVMVRALYDYVAQEDNEISFFENDLIKEVDFIDKDWWVGTCHGRRGMFPANYVERI
ncbi:App1 protein [Schizosaccharomyces japonicus yFS275]|uniref:App1 protein n=1 Tax=Schizosaccharomyces japonicus (strain yFS275 / FY16936) TaxID=402676 RepID=B6K0L0_SCHJY|nr:App1 protein [Schizosaccharomyces japonicus yFS275]EEB07481.1 App1 protein [Schizosaccharomyces japonicus yFS275]